MDATEGTKKRKADSEPPDGYVCRLCSVPGHWIQVCPTKKTGNKRKKQSDHVPVPGKDPSPEDIEQARELQKIPPPKCFCGLPSRLNKVKKSKEGGDKSRAIGKYFFFCSKKRDDETQCRFARPVDMEINKQKAREGAIKAAKERLKDVKAKKEKEAVKPKQVCKFFAKNGTCKKGKKCEFSHDVQSKKEVKDVPSTKNEKKKEMEEDASGDSSSSDSDSSSDDDVNNNKSEKKNSDDSTDSSEEDTDSDSGSDE